jgi:hypothetical protein
MKFSRQRTCDTIVALSGITRNKRDNFLRIKIIKDVATEKRYPLSRKL